MLNEWKNIVARCTELWSRRENTLEDKETLIHPMKF
jgi:hypothetical protein